MKTRITELFGIQHPIIQGGMHYVGFAELAAAVSNAGGLGALPCAMLDAAGMRRELTAIVNATDKPYQVNFFCHVPPVPDAQREVVWRTALDPYYQEFVNCIRRVPHNDEEPEKISGRHLRSLPAGSGSVRIANVLATLRGVLSTRCKDLYVLYNCLRHRSAPLV